MTNSASISQIAPEFDAFLYAPIGADRNGTPVSVLSVLARLDIDPWKEASELAALSAATATERLALLIGTLPANSSMYRDPSAIAARLVTLLPHRSGMSAPLHKGLLAAGATHHSPQLMHAIILNVVIMVILLSAQWLMASRMAPGQANHPQTATTGISSSDVSPPVPGR